ncbi:helix-turn-helix domain-containing protein [Streptococcus infantarius]|uniref:helix-turn-helix domain-containing protein n=1 Tax=Streptococcus infantarius TaxID=102684 RepID=UPI0022E00380|nr:helix-turn-helix domain-containing protein [Streptococcus infantarius]
MNNKTLIASLRKSKGWTQEILAEKSGISLRTIQRLESGQDVSLDTLRLIAEALEVSVNELFVTFEDDTNKDKIERYSREIEEQRNHRKADNQLFQVGKIFALILIVSLAFIVSLLPESFQGIAGLIWVGILFSSFSIIRYIKYSWWELKLNQKYPLTRGIELTNQSNKDSFLWWKDKNARTILLVIYSGIIPLLYTLKYVVHLF